MAELTRALRLLNERGSASAAYWQCTLCDEGFGSSHEYSEHVNASHEEVVYLDEQSGAYVTCATCKKEVRADRCQQRRQGLCTGPLPHRTSYNSVGVSGASPP